MRKRARSLVVEGVERLEARVTPTASPGASLVGQVFSVAATTGGGVGDDVADLKGLVGAGRDYGAFIAFLATLPH
jgi:hypothetical protein